MTKLEFLNELEARLSQLPKEEIARQRSYYAEILDDMTEDGMDEEAAVAKLGSVQETADRILRETPLPVLVKSRVKPKSGWTALSIVLLVLGSPVWLPIAMALLVVALTICLVVWVVVIVLFAVVLAIGASGLAMITVGLANAFHTFPAALMLLGSGIVCAGLCVFAFLGAVWAAKGLAKLCALFFRWIKSLFIKKEARV